ncbi:MAG: FAD-dependent oxidoreductase, partial [Proteobacteria bacterium]|nr:FAD-dependent oxidoreductase [Pseudomonadota bacterium]
DPKTPKIIQPSQGIHIVLDKSFLPGDSAIMVPHTADGRVLFAIPWHDRVVVGTTDTPVKKVEIEPLPMVEEIKFLLFHASKYLSKDPTPDDVLSVFAGLRPLVGAKEAVHTSALSRDHTLMISHSGLMTITGGKWTTYRKMAEDTVNQAAVLAQLETRDCVTRDLHIHGYHRHAEKFGDLSTYGSDAPRIKDLLREDKTYGELLHPNLKTVTGEIVWAVRQEMAVTVEDFLARRTRALLLDAKASMEAAPKVADVMAKQLGKNRSWKKSQVEKYRKLAEKYLIADLQS